MDKPVVGLYPNTIIYKEEGILEDLVRRNRSYRRFHQEAPVALSTLRELVDLTRLSSSARNLQPLKYVLCCDRDTNDAIFATLAWAGYLQDCPGPPEGERPAAYIVVLPHISQRWHRPGNGHRRLHTRRQLEFDS